VGVDVAGKRGQLLAQELDADVRPRVRIAGGAAFCHQPGDLVQAGRPERVGEVGELDVRPARPVEPRPHQPGCQLLRVRRGGPAGACVQGGQHPQVIADGAGGIVHVQHRGGDPLHRAPRQRNGVRRSAGFDHVRDRPRDLPRTIGILAPAAIRMLPPVSPQPVDQPPDFGHPRISHVLIQPHMVTA
jgi:hypothetical protein